MKKYKSFIRKCSFCHFQISITTFLKNKEIEIKNAVGNNHNLKNNFEIKFLMILKIHASSSLILNVFMDINIAKI